MREGGLAMYDFSIPMAIMDYIPVFFFGITMLILQWSLYASMYKGAYALLAAGTINIFFAGFLKATWKLFYAAGLCDFYLLNDMFLPFHHLRQTWKTLAHRFLRPYLPFVAYYGVPIKS